MQLENRKSIISYEKDFDNLYLIVGRRNPIHWKGEVETHFDFVVSSDKRIIDAYKSFGVPEFIEKAIDEKPKRKRRSKPKIKS